VLDILPPVENGLTPAAVDIGRGQIVQALVVATVVVVIDEFGKTRFELSGQVVVLQQNLILQGAVVALDDLALGHGVIGFAADVIHRVLG